MKLTAVDWLCNEWSCIDRDFDLALIDKKTYWQKLKSIQEQAKAMEKEQMEYIYIGHNQYNDEYETFEEYYNETFKSE